MRFLHSTYPQLYSGHFTSVFPWSLDLFVPVPAQLPGEHRTLLPSQHWKLFKRTSNHCIARYPFTPRSRECTNRWSTLPKDTVPHHNNRDPYLRPLEQSLRPPHYDTLDVYGVYVQIQGHQGWSLPGSLPPSKVLVHPTQCQWDCTTIYVVMRATRDTRSQKLRARNKSPQATLQWAWNPGPPPWQVHTLSVPLCYCSLQVFIQ